MGELVPLVESYGVDVRINKPTTIIKNVYTTSIGVNGGEYKLDAFKNNNLGDINEYLIGKGINETPEWTDIGTLIPYGGITSLVGGTNIITIPEQLDTNYNPQVNTYDSNGDEIRYKIIWTSLKKTSFEVWVNESCTCRWTITRHI